MLYSEKSMESATFLQKEDARQITVPLGDWLEKKKYSYSHIVIKIFMTNTVNEFLVMLGVR